jgi:hypothetical protein
MVASTNGRAKWQAVAKRGDVHTPSPHDNAEGYPNPRAWYHVKQGLGQEQHIGDMMQAIEAVVGARANPRIFMAVALHHWLQLGPVDREKAFHSCYTQTKHEWWALVDEETLEEIIQRDGEREPDRHGITPADMIRLRALRAREDHAVAYAESLKKYNLTGKGGAL